MTSLVFVVKLIALIMFPLAVLKGGGWVMSAMTDHCYVANQLAKPSVAEDDREPLNRRCGYDADAVGRHWLALDKKALGIERRYLEVDLLFPFVYGFALAFSLWSIWSLLGRPFSGGWILAPVAIAMLADWVENLVQLDQLARFKTNGVAGLQSAWIQIASVATVTKLTLFMGAGLFLLGLAAWAAYREFE